MIRIITAASLAALALLSSGCIYNQADSPHAEKVPQPGSEAVTSNLVGFWKGELTEYHPDGIPAKKCLCTLEIRKSRTWILTGFEGSKEITGQFNVMSADRIYGTFDVTHESMYVVLGSNGEAIITRSVPNARDFFEKMRRQN